MSSKLVLGGNNFVHKIYTMIFSKSFGYAVRGILYLASTNSQRGNIQADEIALSLSVPKHFMSKILKKLAHKKIIKSVRGPNGGFSFPKENDSIKLIEILRITDAKDPFDKCILQWKQCNSKRPCPMHGFITPVKNELQSIFHEVSISDLSGKNAKTLLKQLMN